MFHRLGLAPVSPLRSWSEEAFSDIAKSSGVSFHSENSATTQKYLPETMCGGVAVFDYDNDGRLDIFFTNGARH